MPNPTDFNPRLQLDEIQCAWEVLLGIRSLDCVRWHSKLLRWQWTELRACNNAGPLEFKYHFSFFVPLQPQLNRPEQSLEQ